MTINTNESSFLLTGRNMRNVWRTQAEEEIQESLEYSKRSLTLLDYLASVSHAGNEISIRTMNFESRGALVHIGKDFFSIASPSMPRLIHSFALNSEHSLKTMNIEIDVLGRTDRAQNVSLLRHDKSFRSLLDDISSRPDHNEIETEQGHLYVGKFSLMADSIAITENAISNPEKSLIQIGTTIVPISGIVSILYAV